MKTMTLEQLAEKAAKACVKAENAQCGQYSRGNRALDGHATKAYRRFFNEAERLGMSNQQIIAFYSPFYSKELSENGRD